ncbi:MAG: hypothetical protein J0I23_28090 [Rhizobiales bacterium]|nr:hypothetical protein [Hyphomicrobiales bacterium]
MMEFDRISKEVERQNRSVTRWARIALIGAGIFWLFWMAFAAVALWLIGRLLNAW